VEDVECIFLLKLRPADINYGDQFKLDDPYGRDLLGEGYIKSFLRGSYQAETTGTAAPGSPPRLGYQYVEAIDPKNAQRYRYTGSIKDVVHTSSILMGGDGTTNFSTKDFVIDRVTAPDVAPRYGVTYDDISTHEEREYWIAGSSLKIIDLQTNEVMAERVGYMIDVRQGSRAGGRSPWLFAADHACPKFSDRNGAGAQGNQTLDFTEKILKPKITKGE
jgi:hypothetical protein